MLRILAGRGVPGPGSGGCGCAGPSFCPCSTPVVVPSGFRTTVQPYWWMTPGDGTCRTGRSPGCWSCRRRPCGSGGAPRRRRRAGRSRRGTGSAGPAGSPRGGSRPGYPADPDVQRQARAAQPGAELPAAQEAGQPARTRTTGPTALPMMACSRASRARAASGVGRSRAGAAVAGPSPPGRHRGLPPWRWRSLSELGAQPDQVIQGGGVDVAGDDGGEGRVAGERAGGVAVQPRPAVAAAHRGGGPARGPCARTRAVHSAISAELPSSLIRSARDTWTRALTGCPARSGSSSAASRRRIASCSASWYRCACVRVSSAPGRGGQRVQHRADHRRALRGQVPRQDTRAAERGHQPERPVLQPAVGVLIGQVRPGPLVELRGQRGQAPQVHPGVRGA